MGFINDMLYKFGPRTQSEHRIHDAYDRGEIHRETRNDALDQNRRFSEAASRLTVADYERVYGRR
ncbi:MAG: hypothetical protein WC869_00760 [Phycisphaerae bacterium]|jgi:hypothetical protein